MVPQGRNRIVCDAIELKAFFEWLFSSVPVNVPSAQPLNSHAQCPLQPDALTTALPNG
jgi:hypothetical protein